MGQSIVVNEKPSSNPGVIRFETNRALTGMDHERYLAGQDIWGHRPPDELARRLLDKPSVAGVQINGNMVTVDLTPVPDAGFGSEVTLWGRARNGAVLPIDEVAQPAGTIGYELMCAVAPRVPVVVEGA